VNLELSAGGMSEDNFQQEVCDADLVLTWHQPVTAEVVGHATRLRGIVKYGVGIDAIDVEAARRRVSPKSMRGASMETREAMFRLEEEPIARCVELLDGDPVLVRSADRRLASKTHGVGFSG
jgi:phosphoglycerate dehydrogenase-like enzyme